MKLLNIDRRRITKRDLYTKARMLAEGVRVEVVRADLRSQNALAHPAPTEETVHGEALGSLLQRRAETDHHVDLHDTLGKIFILDHSGIPAPIWRDSRSPLLLEIDGKCGRLLENSREIARGRVLSSLKDLPWCGQIIDGTPIESILYLSSPGIINMEFTVSCYNHNAGMACLYCGLYASPVLEKFDSFSFDSLREYAALQAKALKAATDTGWRGNIAISGGALTPELRKEYLERTEILVDAIHRTLDSTVVDELTLVYCHYPPEDFSDFKRLKDMGIEATSMDLEVVDDEAFRRICPGKHAYKPLSYWRKAQEAAVEVLGPYWHTVTNVVVGLEPLDRLVEGVEERLSKGVLVIPLQFCPTPGSAMAKARPRDARWIMEATERLADCYASCGPELLKVIASESLHRLLSRLNPRATEKAPKNPLGYFGKLKLYQLAPAIDEIVGRIMKVPGSRLLPLPTAD